MERVIQTLRNGTLPREGAGSTDGQLLERYLSCREEAAFAALMHRHGSMVWGVCRRTLRSQQDAEDAFQATFLVLVRKAACIKPREKVANWLYGVAHQTAVRVRATAAKRRRREKQVTAMPEPTTKGQTDKEGLEALLDEELSRLPEKYREVIVLCDLEGKTRKEAARHFHLPEGTVATRLATARAMLARRLVRRGLPVTGGALAALLAQGAASACVPASVVSCTIKAASLFAAGQVTAGGVFSLTAVSLAEGVLKTMLLNKLKITTVVLLALATLGAGAAAVAQQVLAYKPPEPLHTATRAAGQAGKESKLVESDLKTLSGVVQEVDAGTGLLTVEHNRELRTFTVAKDAAIRINGKPGALAGLPRDAHVALGLSADEKTVRRIESGGPELYGLVKSVDAEKKTLTLEVSHGGGEQAFRVARNAAIVIDGKRGKLAGLPTGANVTLSAFEDHQTVQSIQARGQWIGRALVKAVDPSASTLTVEYGHEPINGEKALPVAKDASIRIDGKPGKLAGLPVGACIDLTLGADQKSIRRIQAKSP
jgi:RNA polymerase sigma factor (sigma-70 family)